jgi:hypothetical protein
MSGQEGKAMFINTYRSCMKILLGIMKHQNTKYETVLIGFDILEFLSNK